MENTTVVVGADFASTGDQALRTGLKQLATGAASTMYVVHVLETGAARFPPEERPVDPAPSAAVLSQGLRQRLRTLAKLDGVTYREEQVHIEIRSGEVLAELLDAIHEHRADLAVVGTHGRRGVGRWLVGSIAETLVRKAECSVLIARPPRARRVRVESAPVSARELAVDASPSEPDWRPRDVAAKHPIP